MPAPCFAQLALRVQSDTRVEVHSRVTEDGLALSGRLMDNLGQPVPDQALTVELFTTPTDPVAEYSSRIRTQADGTFALGGELEARAYHVRVSFPGSALHLASRVDTRIRLDRAPVTLTLQDAPRVLDDADPEQTFLVTARSSVGGAGLELTLEQDGTVHARARTDADGLASLHLATTRLSPGAATLLVRSQGDQRRAEATLVHRYVRKAHPSLTLAAERLPGREVTTVKTRLFLGDRGISEQPIGVFAGSRHIRTVLTDASGRAAWTALDRELGADAGDVTLVARFDPSEERWEAATSQAVVVRRARTRPSVLWLLLPLVVLALAWLVRAVRRSAGSAGVVDTAGADGVVSISMGRSRTFARELRMATGTVSDIDEGDAIAGVLVSVRGEDGDQPVDTTETDGAGRFAFASLPNGKLTLELRCAGYAPEAVPLAVPHRGQGEGMLIRLRSLRNVMWRDGVPLVRATQLASDLLPTAREALARLAHRPDVPPDTDRLVRELEQIVYGPTTPDPEEVRRIAERVAQTLESLQPIAPK